jgi:hypothetical protein
VKAWRGRIVEKNLIKRGIEKNKERRNIEYSTIGHKVVVAFIIFKICRREGI